MIGLAWHQRRPVRDPNWVDREFHTSPQSGYRLQRSILLSIITKGESGSDIRDVGSLDQVRQPLDHPDQGIMRVGTYCPRGINVDYDDPFIEGVGSPGCCR